MIFASVIPLLKQSFFTLAQITPTYFEADLALCLDKVTSIDGVIGYSEVHFWSHTREHLVGTIHVQIKSETSEQQILQKVTHIFKSKGVSELCVEVQKPVYSPSGLPHNFLVIHDQGSEHDAHDAHDGHDHDHDHDHEHGHHH